MMAKKPGFIRRAWNSIRALVGAGGSGEDLFKGASSNRLNWDWVTSALASADDEVRAGLRTLRSRSRALARNSAIVRKYLNLVKINIVGPNGFGIAASFMRGKELDTELNTTVEKAWRRWASGRVTLDGTMNLAQLQRLLARTVAVDGEAFVRMWVDPTANSFAFALEPIDPDLVDDSYDRPSAEGVNEIKMGIEVDSKGRPVAYHVLSNARANRRRTAVPASEIVHLYDPERIHQHRGLPWIYGVMHRVKMLDGYYEAELVAARAAAAKMGFFVRKDGMPGSAPEADSEMDASPGTIEFAPEGWEFQSWDPDHPTAAFPEFVKAIRMEIASGLPCSYANATGDLSNANYSALRHDALWERDVWETHQDDMISAFLVPILKAWSVPAALRGHIPIAVAGPTITDWVSFEGRGFPWVSPRDEIAAIVTAIDNGLISRTQVARERGVDIDQVFAELEAEQAAAKEKGIDIDGGLGGGGGNQDATASSGSGGGADAESDGEDGASNGNGNGNGKKAALPLRLASIVTGVRERLHGIGRWR